MAKKTRSISGLSGTAKKSACKELESLAVKSIVRLAKGKKGKITNIVPSFEPTRLDAVIRSAQGLKCDFLEKL